MIGSRYSSRRTANGLGLVAISGSLDIAYCVRGGIVKRPLYAPSRSLFKPMATDQRTEFEQALGETFGEFVSPPVPFEDASPHECCEVIWHVVGDDVTPAMLAALNDTKIEELAKSFGEDFECDPPTVDQIRDAISHTLARWPIRSLDKNNPV